MVENLQIGSIQPLKPGSGSSQSPGSDSVKGPSFEDILKQSLQEVNDLQHDAEGKIKGLYSGEIKDLHQVMVAVEDADVAFRLMMQIRNKLVDSYQELMRMQV